MLDTDILVLGSGMAGLSYAIKAATHGDVVVLTKKEDSEANTNYAQGGIAAAMDPADSVEAHLADTLETGAGLCDPEAVRLLVESGPARVRELIDLGVEFTYRRDDPHRLSLAREGGHSARRIVRADDLTGRAIERGLLGGAERAGVRILEHVLAIDLWVDEIDGAPRCRGALAVDRLTAEPVAVRARMTYLATGGCGRVYRFTTNPAIATGDGIAMAWRAGAAVENMEFIQFHPTALYPVDERPFLISEAVRGEGAVLRDDDGRPFMIDYDERGDLAPRDVVARAIRAETRRSGTEHAWLDCSPIPSSRFAERFPNILATCRARGLDPPVEPLPVVPAAHYVCGGVATDLDAATGIDRLLAVGEVACTGVHGANRLASNSLLEAVVFADRAAARTALDLARSDRSTVDPPEGWLGDGPGVEPDEIAALRSEIGRVTWEGAGIVRDDDGLARAARELDAMRDRIPSKGSDPAAIELANLHTVATLIVRSAALRRESRGLHFTTSHPETDPAFRRPTVLTPDRP